MASATLSQTASDRPLALRARADLEVRAQQFGRDRYWAIKDPVALKYFHLREEEYAVLSQLDGRTSLEEIRRNCEERFAPRRFTHQQLHGFVATLHHDGLVLANSPGQGEQLLERRGEQIRQKRYRTWSSVLAIRFRGISPRPLLDWLLPKCAWLFSPLCMAVTILFALAALVLVVVEFDQFTARLPELKSIVQASNLPWLVLVLAGTKMLHELGHALACRYFGGECHEIGLMLLVFTPCLYCNVSDSWLLPSKWQRMAIAAAGMYFELIVATICTFLWWFSQPGLLNSLSLNVVLVCSVGTLLFNGNPLLQYDGYFILSDLLEVPNLSSQASAALRRVLGGWLLGAPANEDRGISVRHTSWLALYAVASMAYKLFVVGVVLWGLREFLRPYNMEAVVVLLGCLSLGAMFSPAVMAIVTTLRNPARGQQVAPSRALLSGVIVVLVILALLLVPMPMRVAAPVVVEYRDAIRVYVTEPGTLVAGVKIGEHVEKGQVLARLTNAQVDMEVARLTSDRDQARLFLADLEARRLQGTIDGARIPAAKSALADVEVRLAQRQRDAARLTILSPATGTVLPPPELPRKTGATDKLEAWAGHPLDERNERAFLDVGTLVCLIGEPTHFEAVLHVEQTDIELVAPGQRVKMLLDHLPGEVFAGTVTELAKRDLKVMPRELATAGDVPSRVDERGVSHPLDTWYQASVRFDHDPPHLLVGTHGSAKISVVSRSLGSQFVRYLKQTFSR